MLDDSRADGNRADGHQTEQKLAQKKLALAEAEASAAELEIRASGPGEIAETLVDRGASVAAGAPVLRVRATGPRALFPLSDEGARRARTLPFCRVETIPGTGGGDSGAPESAARPLDCTLATSELPVDEAGRHELEVDLTGKGAESVPAGTAVRLALARYDGVFPVPRSALILAARGGDEIYVIAAGTTTAERRAVQLAADEGGLVLVSQGIRVGDAVIVDPPASLASGGEVRIER